MGRFFWTSTQMMRGTKCRRRAFSVCARFIQFQSNATTSNLQIRFPNRAAERRDCGHFGDGEALAFSRSAFKIHRSATLSLVIILSTRFQTELKSINIPPEIQTSSEYNRFVNAMSCQNSSLANIQTVLSFVEPSHDQFLSLFWRENLC